MLNYWFVFPYFLWEAERERQRPTELSSIYSHNSQGWAAIEPGRQETTQDSHMVARRQLFKPSLLPPGFCISSKWKSESRAKWLIPDVPMWDMRNWKNFHLLIAPPHVQMPATDIERPGWTQELRIASRSPSWVVGIQASRPVSTAPKYIHRELNCKWRGAGTKTRPSDTECRHPKQRPNVLCHHSHTWHEHLLWCLNHYTTYPPQGTLVYVKQNNELFLKLFRKK